MSKQGIQEKYWIEFLLWYREADDKRVTHWDGHAHTIFSIEDTFWYWLIRIRSKDLDSDFIHKLEEL